MRTSRNDTIHLTTGLFLIPSLSFWLLGGAPLPDFRGPLPLATEMERKHGQRGQIH